MENGEYLAHIKTNPDGSVVNQSCKEHLENSAAYAGEALRGIGLYNSAYFAGLLHDTGKLKKAFQDYLEASACNEKIVKGSVIHTFAGVKLILERFRSKADGGTKPAGEILAYSAGAHHGLFDCIDEMHNSGFLHRLNDSPDDDVTAIQAFDGLFRGDYTERIFKLASDEIMEMIQKCGELCQESDETVFMCGLITRLITSAVMEGDRRDTAEFMSCAVFPQEASRQLWQGLLEKTEEKLRRLPCDTEINRVRGMISDICRKVAEEAPGVYRLNVPTGGGKTLAALRYALAHSAKYNKKRIIFTSPLLSILDQNSKIIREYIGDDSVIVEHHSNVVRQKDSDNEAQSYDLLCESWSCPVIITTLTQLLNTMFDGKSSCVRRFHTLSDSVIVIDEVQTVPVKMLTLFNLTVSFLAHCCNTTVILCSATQPCFEQITHPIRTEIKDIIPKGIPDFCVFKRTDIIHAGSFKLEEIPDFATELLSGLQSLLVVCNKKNQAETVFEAMKSEQINVFYLAASLCAEHRKKTLSEIYESLNQSEKKTVCVSTQVIEAGVDISFDSVIRFEAGLDSIIQSAGRCNRNGEAKDIKPVYVVRVSDEDLSHLTEIKNGKTATQQLLTVFNGRKERFENNLAGDKSVEYYYNSLYGIENGFDYNTGEGKPSLYSMLSWNDGMIPSELDEKIKDYLLRQAFATAGKHFNVFDNDTVDVIVPYKEGEDIINCLLSEEAKNNIKYVKSLIDKAKHYSVSLYSYSAKNAERYNALIPLAGGLAFGLDKQYYNLQTGVCTDFKKEAEKCNILIL